MHKENAYFCTNPSAKVSLKPFQRLVVSRPRKGGRSPQRAKSPILLKAQEGEFAKGKEGTLAGGSLYVSFVLVFSVTFLLKKKAIFASLNGKFASEHC